MPQTGRPKLQSGVGPLGFALSVAVLAAAMLSAVDAFAKPDGISGSNCSDCHPGNGIVAVPSMPSSFAASEDRTDGIRLTWSDPTPSETIRYDIFRSTGSVFPGGSPFLTVGPFNYPNSMFSRLIDDPSATAGTIYHYWVLAGNGCVAGTIQGLNCSFSGQGYASSTAIDTGVRAIAPALLSCPASLSSTVAAGASGTQAFSCTNTGGGTISYSIGGAPEWLSVDPTSGSPGVVHTATFSAAALTPGSFSATITVDGGAAGTQLIAVNLTVIPVDLLRFVEKEVEGVSAPDTGQPIGVAVSSDGHHVYVASIGTGVGGTPSAVTGFARDLGTGALALIQKIPNGTGGASQLGGAAGIALSPDGKHVYVASNNGGNAGSGNAITVFARSSDSGLLDYVETQKDGIGLVDGLDGATSVSLSPDGKNLYVSGVSDGAIAAFQRDPATGRLSFLEVHKDGDPGVRCLFGATGVIVSVDGANVYATGRCAAVDDPSQDGVAVFRRDLATGSLHFMQGIQNGVGDVSGLGGAAGWGGIASSPDGRHIYVTARVDSKVVTLKRDLSTGELTFVEAVGDALLGNTARVAVSPDGTHVLATAIEAGVLARFDRDAATGKLSLAEIEQNVDPGVTGLTAPIGVAISPDGAHVYVASDGEDAIAVFAERILRFVGSVKNSPPGVDGIGNAWSVVLSPDNRSVYFNDDLAGSVASFNRDTEGGAITFLDNDDPVELSQSQGLAASPDGRSVYATGYESGSVAAFSRDTSTGSLDNVEIEQDGQGGVDGLAGAYGVAVSPDGKSVYVAGHSDNSVAAFSRDASTSALTFVEREQDTTGGSPDGLAGASGVAVSPDGKHVYVTGPNEAALAVFTRNATTGALSFASQARDGVGDVSGLDSAHAIALSRDGSFVYVAGGSTVVVFSRNKNSGALSFIEVEQNGVNGVDGLYLAGDSIELSQDGAFVYVGGWGESSIAVFRRDRVTGTLAFAEVVRDGEEGVQGIDGIRGLASARDGFVYATGPLEEAVAIFSPEPDATALGLCAAALLAGLAHGARRARASVVRDSSQ